MPITIDEAISLVVKALKRAPDIDDKRGRTSHPCDLRIPDVLDAWWFAEHDESRPMARHSEADCAPFYDAAWELARRGVLRVGAAFPKGETSNSEPAECYSLTSFGREWIRSYDQQGPFPTDPGRFAALTAQYGPLFGPGFVQRISEAAGCYRTSNYLACCAMTGAALESILLAIAIRRKGDEEAVLKIYRGAHGRKDLINKVICQGLDNYLQQAVQTASSLLSDWRDSAAHGLSTTIWEFEAHDAMSRLLRFAQLCSDNWAKLMAP